MKSKWAISIDFVGMNRTVRCYLVTEKLMSVWFNGNGPEKLELVHYKWHSGVYLNGNLCAFDLKCSPLYDIGTGKARAACTIIQAERILLVD